MSTLQYEVCPCALIILWSKECELSLQSSPWRRWPSQGRWRFPAPRCPPWLAGGNAAAPELWRNSRNGYCFWTRSMSRHHSVHVDFVKNTFQLYRLHPCQLYHTLWKRGGEIQKKIKDEDFETFVQNTRTEIKVSNKFNIEDRTTCPHCLKWFSHPTACKEHIKTFHVENSKKKYNCELCQKKFKTKMDYKAILSMIMRTKNLSNV